MKVFATCAAGLLYCVSQSAWSGPSLAYIDAYGVLNSDLELESRDLGRAKFDGDGYGVKGAFTFADRFFASAEYQSVDYELKDNTANNPVDGDLDQLRAGLGIRFESGPALFYVRGEYLKLDSDELDDNDDGYGLHAGVRGENGRLGVTVEGGYVDIGDFSGAEWQAEADYRMFDFIGLFIGYRYTDLGGSNGIDVKFADLRFGATLYFGGKSV